MFKIYIVIAMIAAVIIFYFSSYIIIAKVSDPSTSAYRIAEEKGTKFVVGISLLVSLVVSCFFSILWPLLIVDMIVKGNE